MDPQTLPNNKDATIWSFYGHIMLHKIITNPRGDTQHHNQMMHNSSSTYISSNMHHQPIVLIPTIYTIKLFDGGADIQTCYL